MEGTPLKTALIGNAFLGLGVISLISFALLEAQGLRVDPLLPAFSAFFIGCTAVLDRVGTQQFE